MIEMCNVTKTYTMGASTFEALKGVSFKIETGELVAIIGPSGSGKSTTMNILGLLDHPTTGEYYLDNKNIDDMSSDNLANLRNYNIGFIFQSFFLLPRLTALNNIILPLRYRGLAEEESKKIAMAVLEKVEMAQFYDHKPFELSGGQQQRIAIARALVGNPKVILADEPTGALDSKTSKHILDFLIELNREEKATVVIITHDPEVAEQCSRVIKVYDGNIVE